jgi:hypothetical protein
MAGRFARPKRKKLQAPDLNRQAARISKTCRYVRKAALIWPAHHEPANMLFFLAAREALLI